MPLPPPPPSRRRTSPPSSPPPPPPPPRNNGSSHGTPRQQGKRCAPFVWLIPLALLLTAAFGTGIYFLLANRKSDEGKHKEKEKEQTEDARRMNEDDGELSAGAMKDVPASAVGERMIDNIPPDSIADNGNFAGNPYDAPANQRHWAAACTEGRYRLTVTLTDNKDPDKRYYCHVDFSYPGNTRDLLYNCIYYNDSYNTQLSVTASHDADKLVFQGREGDSSFGLDMNWTGGNSFAGHSWYGSNRLKARATLTRL